ncbi:MAG: sodium:solute symporter family protein, partial [Calditrichaeota bacterium]|nr:sodium:solute symporter family protein [Calditrichota bacterium]
MFFYGLHALDIAVIALYFIGIIFIGSLAGRRVKNTTDFFLGGRRFGKMLSIAQTFGTGTNVAQLILVAGAAFQLGISGIWYQWYWLFLTPFFWLIAPIYRRLRYVTMADFFENRFGPVLGKSYTILGLVYIVINSGMMLKSVAITVEGVTSGAISQGASIYLVAALVMIYGISGGLIAAAITDVVQGVLTIVFSLILVPLVIAHSGGLSTLHLELSQDMFRLFASEEVTPFFLIATIANGLVSVVVYPHHMAMLGSARNEQTARIGWVGGMLIKRVVIVGWVFTGLFCAALFPGLVETNRELAFGLFVRQFIPAGLLGFVVAALLAAVMSTCDAFMIAGAALFTRNLPMPARMQAWKARHSLLSARMFTLLVLACSVFFALSIPTLVEGQKVLWRVMALFGVPFWLGLLWRRANAAGAIASIVSALAVILLTGHTWGLGLNWPIEKQIVFYLPAGFLAMILGSVWSSKQTKDVEKNFWQRLCASPSSTDTSVKPSNSLTGLFLLDVWRVGIFKWQKYKSELSIFMLIGGIVLLLVFILKLLL